MLALTVAPGQYVRPRIRRYSPDLRVVREKPYFDTSQDWLWDTRTSVLHSSRGSASRNWTAAVGSERRRLPQCAATRDAPTPDPPAVTPRQEGSTSTRPIGAR